ncbi:hypothetical protein RWK44_16740 [Rhizobium sp. 25PS6]|uniref:hypothetical protein n=1 Tax=Rhizobium TaxID=379 RepID=UPI00037DC605|nr:MULTISPECIES: hypothetical protein [Rhizobium]MBN9981497.1 hypothetical protein [Rhizobium laguerreae]MBY3180883.1 hypothetical protein [Rhizobium laguerreae]MBY3225305.1 hypothetical protein [Rhizobium laguerreae]MBY3234589.1 hypothetical protein [Rhizobium laguerreae]MBY3267349.1 hypothetical protein [Rhizobium laguerreae]
MTTTFKNGLMAAAFGAILGLSAFSATAAPLQSSATEQGAAERPVAQQETTVRHDRRTTGSIGDRASETTGSTPYMMDPKKPLKRDCKLGFNPGSGSSCNY